MPTTNDPPPPRRPVRPQYFQPDPRDWPAWEEHQVSTRTQRRLSKTHRYCSPAARNTSPKRGSATAYAGPGACTHAATAVSCRVNNRYHNVSSAGQLPAATQRFDPSSRVSTWLLTSVAMRCPDPPHPHPRHRRQNACRQPSPPAGGGAWRRVGWRVFPENQPTISQYTFCEF